jgi:hypothetical protein
MRLKAAETELLRKEKLLEDSSQSKMVQKESSTSSFHH